MGQNKFPKDFLWGASTSAHQVEGGTVNQWSAWELANASELAKTAEKRYGKRANWARIMDIGMAESDVTAGDLEIDVS